MLYFFHSATIFKILTVCDNAFLTLALHGQSEVVENASHFSGDYAELLYTAHFTMSCIHLRIYTFLCDKKSPIVRSVLVHFSTSSPNFNYQF